MTVRASGKLMLLALASAVAVGDSGQPSPVHPQFWPRLNAVRQPDAAETALIDGLLGKMTLEEKVGQMLQADISSASPEDVRTYHLGSVLAGGGSAPRRELRVPPQEWLDLTRSYATAARSADAGSPAAIPILFGIDAVHGHGHVRGSTIYPHNIGLGATGDAPLVRAIGAATAAEVAATGMDWVFAPTVAVVQDPRWGRTYEGFSDDPAVVARLSAALVTGLQRGADDAQAPAGRVLATLKHFIGDGATRRGRDQGETVATEHDLQAVHSAGYRAGVQAGALTVMASYSSWHGQKMHINHALLTDVLKGRLGFDGFVIGDWNGHEQVPGCTKFDCPSAILAGVDMVMAADGWRQFRDHLLAEVRDGTIPQTRIDDAVRRILRVKYRAGLFQAGSAAERASAAGVEVLGAPEHRALARDAVRRSLVLLKNEGQVLPIAAGSHVLVAGGAGDDIGLQCGGWTIDWQGDHNRNEDFPGATSVLAGLRAALEPHGGAVEFSPSGGYTRRPDVAVVVFGERPYAEFDGDREALLLQDTDAQGLDLLRRYRSAGIPTVAVLLTGRPLWVSREINASSSFVVAWLPGTEGAGIADVLVAGTDGRARYDFTGRLPMAWPASAVPAPVSGSRGAGVLYARGYGRRLGDRQRVVPADENPHAPLSLTGAHTLFAQARVHAPWSVFVKDPQSEFRVTLPTVSSSTGALRVALGEQGLHAAWAGGKPAEVIIAGRAVDLSAATRPDAALQLTYRVTQAPVGRVRLGFRCSGAYGEPTEGPEAARPRRCGLEKGALEDRTELLAGAPGTWRRFILPMRCLTGLGADLRRVGSPLVVAADAPFEITISDARIVDFTGAADCTALRSTASVPPARGGFTPPD